MKPESEPEETYGSARAPRQIGGRHAQRRTGCRSVRSIRIMSGLPPFATVELTSPFGSFVPNRRYLELGGVNALVRVAWVLSFG